MVECFMLEVEPEEKTTMIVEASGSLDGEACHVTGQLSHRVEVDVPEGFALKDADDRVVTCACGLELNQTNSDVCIRHSSSRYRNPKTGVVGRSPTEVATPGAMWFAAWMIEPDEPVRGSYFSRFYVEDWFDKRAPLVVRCPDGRDWMVDQKSSNGEGWKVTGEPPLITCQPSIDTGSYHAFLTNGVFAADLSGRTYERTP